ncbi:MAG: hypothetical protein AAGI23_19530 [Bacteroidota bacterium]
MKAKIHKGCSCIRCKIGRTKDNRVRLERVYRRRSKITLKKGETDILLNGVGYTD